MPHKMFTTSEAILKTSSELRIEVGGAVVRLVSLEEGPRSSIENETLLSVNQTPCKLRVEVRARGIQISLCIRMPPTVHCQDT